MLPRGASNIRTTAGSLAHQSSSAHHEGSLQRPVNLYSVIRSPLLSPARLNMGIMSNRTRKVDLSDSLSPVPGEESDMLAYIYGIVGPSIVTFGLIGNILILVVVKRSSMAGAIAVYLSALALSDMGALLSSIPLWIRLSHKVACSHWNAFYYAHFELFVLNTFMAASIFNVVALTLERYSSVCLSGKFPQIHTPLRARMAVACAFLLALVISLPLCTLKYVVVYNETDSSVFKAKTTEKCSYQYLENKKVTTHPLWIAYVWLGESLVRFIPAIILATLNLLIMMKFRGVIKNRIQLQQGLPTAAADHAAHGRAERHLEQERKLATLLLSIVVLFFVTNIPSAVLSIIYNQDLEKHQSFQIFRAVANLLEMSNFALNFCMYFLCSKEFRKMLYKAFPRCNIVKKLRTPSTSSTLRSCPPNTAVTPT